MHTQFIRYSVIPPLDTYGTSYDQSLYAIQIVSHIWPFSLPDKFDLG